MVDEIIERALTIDTINTATDWDLVLSEVDVKFPRVKTNYVDIPQSDGSLDLTTSLSNTVHYEMREGLFSFDLIIKHTEREAKLAEIASFLHGYVHKVWTPDDSEHYLLGRLAISDVERGARLNKLTVRGSFYPFKLNNAETVRNETIDASGESIMTIENTGQVVVPTIEATNDIILKVGASSVALSGGVPHKTTLATLYKGENVLRFQGTEGTVVTLTYQEGIL